MLHGLAAQVPVAAPAAERPAIAAMVAGCIVHDTPSVTDDEFGSWLGLFTPLSRVG